MGVRAPGQPPAASPPHQRTPRSPVAAQASRPAGSRARAQAAATLPGPFLLQLSASADEGDPQPEASPSGRQFPSDVARDRGDSLSAAFLQFRQSQPGEEGREPPLVRVKLSVHYRVHSRQLLCIGGSQIPFGWSFLSIAKVPMRWQAGDRWETEVEVPANAKLEYKYVILEEQDWTKQESEDAEGVVTFTYRTRPERDPPDVQTIQKQMAIVAWQPGPNRVVQIPSEDELASLREGETQRRTPARPPARAVPPRSAGAGGRFARRLGTSDFPKYPPAPSGPPGAPGGVGSAPTDRQGMNAGPFPPGDELAGTWEELSLDENGQPLLVRQDVWGSLDAVRNLGITFG